MKKLFLILFLSGLGISLSNAHNFKFKSSKYINGKRITIKEKVQRRRITNLEHTLINSKGATKTRVSGRTVVKRNIFQCNKNNISLMLKGKAPIGYDNKKAELHHLKQQKDGNLIELTQTEHNKHSKILHRYVKKSSEITDRKNGFSSFRQKYWKSRATDCIAKSR